MKLLLFNLYNQVTLHNEGKDADGNSVIDIIVPAMCVNSIHWDYYVKEQEKEFEAKFDVHEYTKSAIIAVNITQYDNKDSADESGVIMCKENTIIHCMGIGSMMNFTKKEIKTKRLNGRIHNYVTIVFYNLKGKVFIGALNLNVMFYKDLSNYGNNELKIAEKALIDAEKVRDRHNTDGPKPDDSKDVTTAIFAIKRAKKAAATIGLKKPKDMIKVIESENIAIVAKSFANVVDNLKATIKNISKNNCIGEFDTIEMIKNGVAVGKNLKAQLRYI